jgi:hypothetical protein
MFSTTHREDNCQDHRRLTTASQRGYFGRCGLASGDAGCRSFGLASGDAAGSP